MFTLGLPRVIPLNAFSIKAKLGGYIYGKYVSSEAPDAAYGSGSRKN